VGKQVARRVAGGRQLAEHHQLRLLAGGLRHRRRDFPEVGVEGADGEIQLREGDPHAWARGLRAIP
jgi:hypothetical protein